MVALMDEWRQRGFEILAPRHTRPLNIDFISIISKVFFSFSKNHQLADIFSSSSADVVGNVDKSFPLPPGFTTRQRPSSSPDALFPSLTTGAAFRNDLAVVAMTHIAGVSLADT
jgi:hypothetical protein